MRNFTARYLEDVGIGDGVFQDVVPGELARPNLSTLVVDELPGWLETPNLDTPVSEAVLHGRMTATMLVPFRSDNAGQHRQAIDRPPLSDRGFHQRQPAWLRLAVDTPFLIEDRVLKFTVHREGTSTGSVSAGWQVVAILQDGTEVVLTGTAHIPDGEDSVEVTIDFDAISLPSTNYASVELYWSWGIPMHSSRSSRGGTAIEVSEDAPFYTRSLVHEPWLYWGDHFTWNDMSGNNRGAVSESFVGEPIEGAQGCFGTALALTSGRKVFWSSPSKPTFDSPLEQWSASLVFRVPEPTSPYHRVLIEAGSAVRVYVPYNNQSELWLSWGNIIGATQIGYLGHNDWHHVVLTYDGSQYGGFLDGSELMIWDQPTILKPLDGIAMGGGRVDLDDFAVWDRVLSSSDVQYIYAGLG